MNKVEVKVQRIRSYQTLIGQSGRRRYRKPEYKAYIQEVSYQLARLKPIERNKKVGLHLHFKYHDRRKPDIDNARKPIQDILEMSGKIIDDKHISSSATIETFDHKESSIVIHLFALDDDYIQNEVERLRLD